MNDILPMLQAIKPPKPTAAFDSTIMYEAEQACPGLAYYAQQEEQDPWMKGMILSLYSIYSSMSDVGEEEILTELTVEFITEVDNQLATNAENILKDLPNVIEFMEKVETDNGFKAGAVCAFSCVLMAIVSPEEPKVVSDLDDVIVEAGDSGEADYASNETVGLTFLLTRLYVMGLNIQEVRIIPFITKENPEDKSSAEVRLSVTGPMGAAPDFSRVATVNAIFKSIGDGRDIKIVSRDEQLWYEYVL